MQPSGGIAHYHPAVPTDRLAGQELGENLGCNVELLGGRLNALQGDTLKTFNFTEMSYSSVRTSTLIRIYFLIIYREYNINFSVRFH